MNGTLLGPLDLLVIQPTPFCNIDCSYCYLPNRQSKQQISADVLEHTFARVFASGLVQDSFTVIWHAGEPLVLPPEFYERAMAIAARHNSLGARIWHSFQTNGTLIDAGWCTFLKHPDVRIGVSVDGPEFLHDKYRRTRGGKGTHARVMQGIRQLHEHGIPFHVISVLTHNSLDYPDELYEFYRSNGIEHVGFNIEEIEGPHRSSSLLAGDARSRFTRFLDRFFELAISEEPPLRVREIDCAMCMVAGGPPAGPIRTQETTPLAIISVDCTGRFSTFSPELLGLPSKHYGDFDLGHVQTDSFQAAAQSAKFQAIHADIAAGVERCRQTCPYFKFCGGGAPVNKYFENGTFDSTETLFCRLGKQAVLDVVLDKLERHSSKSFSGEPQATGG